MDLFTPVVQTELLHPIFARLIGPDYGPERAVLQNWATGFVDRDYKLVRELQTTFDSVFWELYLHAALKEWGAVPDYSVQSPDFVITSPHRVCIEAVVAGPEKDGQSPFGSGSPNLPDDFTSFNIESALRLTNSFDTKVRRFREYYTTLAHCKDRPFLIAICALDRPGSQFAASRPALAAFYGLYYDEQETPVDAPRVVSYDVAAAVKASGAAVPVGLFRDDTYSEVSAVIYSPLVTWGKLRSLSHDSPLPTLITTFRPNPAGLLPLVVTTSKVDYTEHLMDGLYLLHNPFAKYPLPLGMFSHPRIAEVSADATGSITMTAPRDFLLCRILMSQAIRRD